VGLTERGRAAAAEVRKAVERVDAELATKVSQEDLAGARVVLGAIVEMGDDHA
jgi:DNA-binding MarR family transcriptional regulator